MRRRIGVLVVAAVLFAGARSAATARPDEPVPGATPTTTPHLALDAPATFTFAGKTIVVPAGAEYRLVNGSLVIRLTEKSEKSVAVVKIGETFVVISREEPLTIDPRGRLTSRRRFLFTLPGLRQFRASSISDAPDASPIRP